MWQSTKELREKGDIDGTLIWGILEHHYPGNKEKQTRFLGFMNDFLTEQKKRRPKGVPSDVLFELARKWSVEQAVVTEALRHFPGTQQYLAATYEFFPEGLRKKLPPLGYGGEQKDPMVYAKFFTPWTNWTWYAMEFDGEDTFFGWVVGLEKEFGSFSLSELQSITGPGGLRIERDKFFQPKPISEVMKEHGETLAMTIPKSTTRRLPQTKVVTVTCPVCGKTIEVPGYDKVTRSEALKRHMEKEHSAHGRYPQTMPGGEPIPPEYRDLIGFINEPLPEYSLAVLPAIEVAEGERKIDVVLRQLKDGVENIQDSSRFRLFLTTMAKFHDYSIGNLILIAIQKPGATHVAGFVTWKDLGRWVRGGERGIAILAPVMPPKPKKEELEAEEEEIELAPVYFKVVHVFDISQTEGKPLPEFEVPVLSGEANEVLFTKVMVLAKSQGLDVSFEPRPQQDPAIKGQYFGKSIWVRPEEPRAQQLKSLIHELAHYYSEGVFRIARRDAETIAESAAFTVGAHYGFDSGVRSFPYVALWAQDKKVLEQNLGSVRKVATVILESLEKAQGGEKLLPALKPFDPYKFAEYVLRANAFSLYEIPIYSGLTGTNPLRVPDHIWKEALESIDGEFVKQGDLYIVKTPGVERPPDMRAAPTWREVGTLMSTEPLGTCYEDAWRFLIREEEGELIHGSVQTIGKRINHAWVELPSFVWEPKSGESMRKDYFYEIAEPQEQARYTTEEAAIMAARTGNLGPWTEQERKQYLEGESPAVIPNPDFEKEVNDKLASWSKSYDLPAPHWELTAADIFGYDPKTNSIFLPVRMAILSLSWPKDFESLWFHVAHEFAHYLAQKKSVSGILGLIELRETYADEIAEHLTGVKSSHAWSALRKLIPEVYRTLRSSYLKEKSPAVIPTQPSPPSLKEELEFVADSPEYLAYTIEDIGYREKLDEAFETAIARARGE